MRPPRHTASVAALLVAGCATAGHGHHVDHAHHRFEDPEHWARVFESPERDAWQKPDEVLRWIGLRGHAQLADIGAGTGYFAMRVARAHPQARVVAVDIEPKMVGWLEARARRDGLMNVIPRLGTPEDPRLDAGTSHVLVVNTYHHIDDRAAYFSRLRRKLTPGGRVIIVDFKLGDLPVGPPEHARIGPDRVVAELTEAGYRLRRRDETLLPYQYVIEVEVPFEAGEPKH